MLFPPKALIPALFKLNGNALSDFQKEKISYKI